MHSNLNDLARTGLGAEDRHLLARVPRLAISIALAICVYLLVTRVINPGFFDPLVPTHSDTWRYFAYSKTDFAPSDFQAPRPLMLVALKLMGVFDGFSWFVAVVLLPAVLLPAILVRTAELVLGQRAGWCAQAAYYTVCYSLASFYELQTLDFGGCLAGIAACATVLAFQRVSRAVQSGTATLPLHVTPLFLAWISMECKPTYGLVLAAAPIFFVSAVGRRRVLMQAVSVMAVILLVLVKDRLLGSPFVGVNAGDGSSYQVGGGLAVMAKTLWFYIGAMLPLWAWPLALMGLWMLWRTHGHYAALIAVALAILAVAPMVAIPNNKVAMYSWFGATLLVLPLILARQVPAGSPQVKKIAHSAIFWILVACALVSIARSDQSLRYWYSLNQKSNAQTLKGIDALIARSRPGQRILVAGPLNAHTPFRNDEFIALRFGYSVDWTVVVPQQHTTLLPFSDSKRHIASNEIGNIGEYDVVALFNEEGRLVKLAPASLYAAVSSGELINELFCRQGARPDKAREQSCLGALEEQAALSAIGS